MHTKLLPTFCLFARAHMIFPNICIFHYQKWLFRLISHKGTKNHSYVEKNMLTYYRIYLRNTSKKQIQNGSNTVFFPEGLDKDILIERGGIHGGEKGK